jgi:hypothetical protein
MNSDNFVFLKSILFIFLDLKTNSAFRKALKINEVGSVDTILKRFRPTVGMNEGDHEAIIKTLKSTSQMPVTGKKMKLLLIYLMERIFM